MSNVYEQRTTKELVKLVHEMFKDSEAMVLLGYGTIVTQNIQVLDAMTEVLSSRGINIVYSGKNFKYNTKANEEFAATTWLEIQQDSNKKVGA